MAIVPIWQFGMIYQCSVTLEVQYNKTFQNIQAGDKYMSSTHYQSNIYYSGVREVKVSTESRIMPDLSEHTIRPEHAS